MVRGLYSPLCHGLILISLRGASPTALQAMTLTISEVRKQLTALGYWVYRSNGVYSGKVAYCIHGEGKPGLLTGMNGLSPVEFRLIGTTFINHHAGA